MATQEAMTSVLWRMKNLSITRGWNLWAEKAMTYRHNFEAIERAVRYIKNQSLLHGWLPWVEMAAKWAEDARITRVCARFFVYNLKREGLKRWRTFLPDLRAARMQAERWRMLNERWDQRQKQQKKKEGEYVELIHAKDPPEARQLRRKFDRREMLRWEIAQEQLRRTAQRNAALARMKGLDDDEPTRPRPATAACTACTCARSDACVRVLSSQQTPTATGIQVNCQRERFLQKNRFLALRDLVEKLEVLPRCVCTPCCGCLRILTGALRSFPLHRFISRAARRRQRLNWRQKRGASKRRGKNGRHPRSSPPLRTAGLNFAPLM